VTDEIRLRVRYGETDQMGAAWHGHHIAWFETARTEYLRRRGATYADMERAGFRFVVVEVGVRYHSPARYDEEILLKPRLVELGAVRVRFDYRVLGADSRLVSTGHTVLACTDRSGRLVRIPREIAARLREDAPVDRLDTKGVSFPSEDL
jgi:acyl-CoA thioester hydrolase